MPCYTITTELLRRKAGDSKAAAAYGIPAYRVAFVPEIHKKLDVCEFYHQTLF